MKLIGPFRQGRKPALRSGFYVRTLRGQLVVQKMPRKKDRVTHPTTLEQMEKFRQAAWLAKYAPASIQHAHRQMVEGTSLLPRDLIIAAMYGRGFGFAFADQRRRYPMAARDDLSQTLDILGTLQGNILMRGAEYWEANAADQAGQQLISGVPGQPPQWQTIGSQGGEWTTVEDVVLPSTLPISAYKDVNIPSTFKILEVLISGPPTGPGIRPLMRFNKDTATDYGRSVDGVSPAGIRDSQQTVSTNGLYPFDTSYTPFDRYFTITAQLMRTSGNLRVLGTFQSYFGDQSNWHGGFYYNNDSNDSLTQLNFASNQGQGLPAGTHIVVMAYTP